MLSETKLKKTLKPKDKVYKVTDRDGLYITVAKSGLITFRFDYKINDRRETLTIGKYGIISLVKAREKLMSAKKLVTQGISPATEKQRLKEQAKSNHFGDWLERWLNDVNYKDSTRTIVEGIVKRDVMPKFSKKALNEITADVLRNHCEKIKKRGTSASAVRVRDFIGNVFTYAKARGVNCENPTEFVAPSTIAVFTPRDRSLSKREIGIFFNTLKNAQTSHSLKVALKLLMLTMVRKSNLINYL